MSFNTTSIVVGATAFALSIIGLSLLRKKEEKVKAPRVSNLIIYPIKSCKGIYVDTAEIAETGFLYDRIFVLVDEKNLFLTQRKLPRMALIDVRISVASNCLIINAPDMPECKIPLQYPESEATIERIKIWGDDCDTINAANHEVNEWLSKFLGVRGVRILRMHKRFIRKTDPNYAPTGQTAFSDGYPFLIMSEASLQEINKTLPTPVTVDNFRPNIVVTGCDAFAEDKWKEINFVVGKEKINMKVVKPCARCTMPNVDPKIGVMDSDHAVTKALKTFRTGEKLQFPNPKWRKELFVGQNIDHAGRAGGKLSVGTQLEIVQ